jgi:O-acetyl-ADP-ribose deacetylase (regulator of RNase III)
MKIEILHNDITTMQVDCIVNAARPSLLGGGGVDGAIHKNAGIELKEYCKTLNGCLTGEAKISPAFKLPCKFIIHTVGPRYLADNDQTRIDLQNCYKSCLDLAMENKFNDIAFPNISTGAYGYPKQLAAYVAIYTTLDFLSKNEFPRKVFFSCFDEENYKIYQKLNTI